MKDLTKIVECPTFKRLYHIRDGVTYEEQGEGRPFK